MKNKQRGHHAPVLRERTSACGALPRGRRGTAGTGALTSLWGVGMLQRPLGSGSFQELGMEQEVDDMDVEDALVVVPTLADVLADDEEHP